MSEKTISRSIGINKELLAILCCPETKQDVSIMEDADLTNLNVKIEKGEVKNQGGAVVKEKLSGGLIRADKKVVYPIKEDIPIMLIEEGIPIE